MSHVIKILQRLILVGYKAMEVSTGQFLVCHINVNYFYFVKNQSYSIVKFVWMQMFYFTACSR